jgi:molybdate transport system ATP-binding protein
MDYSILRVEGLQVTLSGKNVLREISLEIKPGEQWAVFGEAGSGKTILAHILAGYYAFRGRIDFPGHPDPGIDKLVMGVDQQHRFRDLRNQTNFYYQQRYKAFDSECTITVAEDLAVFEEYRFGHLSKIEMPKNFSPPSHSG